MKKLFLIVPCYNEQEALPLFYAEAAKIVKGMECDYEYIFVNDGSKDDTLSILKKPLKFPLRASGVPMPSRGFLKISLMSALIRFSVFMSCDCQ